MVNVHQNDFFVMLHLSEKLLELAENIPKKGAVPAAACMALEHNAAALRALMLSALIRHHRGNIADDPLRQLWLN